MLAARGERRGRKSGEELEAIGMREERREEEREKRREEEREERRQEDREKRREGG